MQIEFGDKRLGAAVQSLHSQIIEQQNVCLRKLGRSRAGEMRYGRLLRNERVSVQKLIDGVCAHIDQRGSGRHVLLIQDTTEINYQPHAKRVSGLGTVGNGSDMGFFLHPVLAVDAQDASCLGLAHLHLWQRTSQAKSGPQTQRSIDKRRQQPIENKESHRWLQAPRQARKRLPQAALMTVVADRESDIYEMWARLPDARTHLLVRACHDRELDTPEAGSLYHWLAQLPPQGSYRLPLSATPKRSAHAAHMQVRYGCTCILRPQRYADKEIAPRVKLWAIEVAEDPDTVVGKEQPVHWRLLTTHPVESLTQALQCVDWYCQRWHIEQTFRSLKRQGLNLEGSLVEDAGRLEKLAALALSAAVHTMQLTLAREGKSQRPASDCFDEDEQALLERVGASLEGKTAKQKNPHARNSLAWAGWIVARLGGWKGYASERKPGPITMRDGLQALAGIRRGWEIAQGDG